MGNSSTNSKHLTKLKEVYTQHLQILEIQKATYGLSCSPHIIIQIRDIRNKIDNINNQLQELQRPKAQRPGRRSIPSDDLERYVTDTLEEQVRNKLEFTAYDIAFDLWRRLPDMSIRQTEVRRIVHLQMRLIVALKLYRCELVKYDTVKARRYFPVEKGRNKK